MKAITLKTSRRLATLASLCPAIAGECCYQAGLPERLSRWVAVGCWFADCVTPGVPAASGIVILAAHVRDRGCGIKAAKAVASKLKGCD